MNRSKQIGIPALEFWSESYVDGSENLDFFDIDHQPEAAQLAKGPDPVTRFKSQSIPSLFFVYREANVLAKLYKRNALGLGTQCHLLGSILRLISCIWTRDMIPVMMMMAKKAKKAKKSFTLCPRRS